MVTMYSNDDSNTSIITSSHNSSPTDITAKLRRLKIQEDLLIQSIKKTLPNSDSGGENIFIKLDLDFKKYEAGLKKSYADIKILFEDVKCTTRSKEILKTLDIDDIKRDVLELDHKIKALKDFAQKEMIKLKKSEKDLIKQLQDDSIRNNKTKKCRKVITKSYSDIVPSPVKNLIKLPFKSPEVQQFQEFISSSSKYGGWKEYNHNIFVRIWQKHFLSEDVDFDKLDCFDKDSFLDEVLEKVSGLRRNDILSHIKWYSRYLYLKSRQQIALDEWRAKTKPKRVNLEKYSDKELGPKKNITKSLSAQHSKRKKRRNSTASLVTPSAKLDYSSDESVLYSTTMKDNMLYSCVNTNEFFKEMDKTRLRQELMPPESGYTKPTKQWVNRCNSKTDLQLFNGNLEDITKLGVPSWRLGISRRDSS